ncbi:MAG: hypothetical protein HY951_03755 [Bacteroidia bacterium]|nr:hypothetical protein [Bacteroidia bacterium]
MKIIISILGILLLFFLSFSSYSQTVVPRFKKTEIMNSGCFAYFPETPANFELNISDDSSLVYTASVEFDNFTYGIIAVKFKNTFDGSLSEHEDLLISHMDYLKTVFNVTNSLGYGKGHTSNFNPNSTGIIDTWEDNAKSTISVKGWIDNNFIGFLYLKGKEEYPNINIKNIFLNGFISVN